MLLRRARGLLVPYLVWTVISVVTSGNLWETGVMDLVLELFGYVSNGLWFFPVLFGLKVMHALYRLAHNGISRNMMATDIVLLGGLEVIVVLLAVLTRQPFIVNMLSYALPYFLAVILVSHDVIQKLVSSEWVVAGAMLVYALVFPYFSFYNTYWTTQVLRIGLSLCVVVICCKFMHCEYSSNIKRINKNRFYRSICVYGENSLAIYVLHGFFIDYKEYFNLIDSAFLTGALSVMLAFLVAVVCVVIAKIIGISSWWSKLLIGK